MTKDVVIYSTGSKFFHWFIAIIVITMLSGSFFLDDLPEQYQSFAYMMHKSFGLTVLFLMVFRLFWIHRSGKPPLPATVPIWQKILSRIVQYSLYVFLLSMALSGWIMSVAGGNVPSYFGLFNAPLPINSDQALSKLMEQSHKIIAWVLIVLIVLHIAGAIKHHFINKDNVLRRMLPGG
jgi:cytochrome b561